MVENEPKYCETCGCKLSEGRHSFMTTTYNENVNTLKQAISSCFSKYSTFKGRACRAEYWFFSLLLTLTSVVLYMITLCITTLVSPEVAPVAHGLSVIVLAPFVMPLLSVYVRRLHDTGHSGWWVIWITLLSILVPFLPLLFLCRNSQPGNNEYGNNPKETESLS